MPYSLTALRVGKYHSSCRQKPGLLFQKKLLCCTIKKYKGIPTVMFIGKVTASAMGRYNPGFALGTVIFIAAGTAM